MRFISSIFMLLATICFVISAYFVGHGLVAGGTWPWLTAAALVVAGLVAGVLYLRLAKNDPQPGAHHGHEGHAHH